MFRHKRRMELVELSGRITGRLGYTRRPEPTPSEGRQRWHNDALSSPQPPPPALFLRDDCGPPGLLGMGTAAASAGAAGPSQGLRAGWSSGRTEAGVHRGERPTHLRERADDRDSEPDYLLRPTRHGPGGINDWFRTVLFSSADSSWGTTQEPFESAVTSSFFESSVTLWIVNKYERWPRPLISAIIHIPCAIYSCSSVTERWS